MEWNDTGIVLSRGVFKENDVWLKVLFREHGLHTVFAFGGLRSRRRFVGCLDVLNVLDCHVRLSRRGTWLELAEASLVRGPRNLRAGGSRLGLAVNCLRFTEAVGVPENSAAESFAFLGEVMEALEEERAPDSLFPLLYRCRIAAILGYEPDLSSCGLCGGPLDEGGLFLVDEGRVRCRACISAMGRRPYGIPITGSGVSALRSLQEQPPASWSTASLAPADRRGIARIIDGFVQFYLGFAWERGRFQRI